MATETMKKHIKDLVDLVGFWDPKVRARMVEIGEKNFVADENDSGAVSAQVYGDLSAELDLINPGDPVYNMTISKSIQKILIILFVMALTCEYPDLFNKKDFRNGARLWAPTILLYLSFDQVIDSLKGLDTGCPNDRWVSPYSAFAPCFQQIVVAAICFQVYSLDNWNLRPVHRNEDFTSGLLPRSPCPHCGDAACPACLAFKCIEETECHTRQLLLPTKIMYALAKSYDNAGVALDRDACVLKRLRCFSHCLKQCLNPNPRAALADSQLKFALLRDRLSVCVREPGLDPAAYAKLTWFIEELGVWSRGTVDTDDGPRPRLIPREEVDSRSRLIPAEGRDGRRRPRPY